MSPEQSWAEKITTCPVCGKGIAGDGPAMCRGTSGRDWYEPFVEDLRTSAIELMWHPRCYVQAEGLEKFLDALRKRDAKNRGEIPRLEMEVQRLKNRIAGLSARQPISRTQVRCSGSSETAVPEWHFARPGRLVVGTFC